MKGSFYGVMGKFVFLLLVAFTCTTIPLWSWDKASLLMWLLQSESRSLQLSPESNTKQVKQMEANLSSMVGMKEHKNVNNTGNQACTYANGKWISDKNWPLYSGLDCKQWLSPMWACRMTHRPNFTYEKLRWQPKDCKTQNFEPSKFLLRMQDKTLAFIGDSLGRQQFQSLMCMITGGKNSPDVQNVGKDYNLLKPRHAIRPNGWAYRFKTSNTTILYYWSASLTNLQPLFTPKTKKVVNYAMHLDRPPAFLHRYIEKFDVLVLNTGHHWNMEKIKANRWIIHVKGVPVLNTNSEIEDIEGAKNFTISSIIKWVDSHLPRNPRLKAFYRTISPSHFLNGNWNTGGGCDNITPPIGKEVVQRSSTDSFAARAVKGTEVKLLDITALSEVRNEGHISRWRIRAKMEGQDCLHWCLPGVPDTWNEILFSQL